MVKQSNLTYTEYKKLFNSEEKCITYLFNLLYADKPCPKCGGLKFSKLHERRVYACNKCGFQICPTANTIFHSTYLPLQIWFFAMFLISNSKNGVSSKELERMLGVSYKTAWRLNYQIKKLFGKDDNDDDDQNGKLKGIVEMDEAYQGGVNEGAGKGNKAGKSLIIGMLERAGRIIARVVGNTKGSTVSPLIEKYIEKKSKIMTDEAAVYTYIIDPIDYSHASVNHSKKEYAREDSHVNNLEGFWSQLKRSINGTYHAVSHKHLQTYINQFAFYYNNRKSTKTVFELMMEKV